jgi:hypothetical protein
MDLAIYEQGKDCANSISKKCMNTSFSIRSLFSITTSPAV